MMEVAAEVTIILIALTLFVAIPIWIMIDDWRRP